MKKKILNGSLVAALIATTITVVATLLSSNHNQLLISLGVAYPFGLLSIAMFFLGLAYPKE